MKYGQLLVLAVIVLITLSVGATEVSAVPGDEDDDGIITGPRLVGDTTFRGCFISGPPEAQSATDVDTITHALNSTG